MKETCIPLDWFDLDGFINEILRFLDAKVNYPTLAITWVEAPGRCPNDETDENWDFRSKLLSEPVYLFFPFALPDMEGSFDCSDGLSHRVTALDFWGEDEQCNEEENGEESDESFVMEDIIGYLVQVKDGAISITTAICPLCGCLPPPTVDLLEEGHFMEEKLTAFANRFVLKNLQVSRSEENGPELDLARYDANARQKPSDMKQEMKQRIKTLFREDSGEGFDVVIRQETPFEDFSVVIETRTEDCIQRQYAYSYYERRKTIRDTYVFARGEVFAEEWEHSQTWGPKSGMNLERAVKLFGDALKEAKRELESEGREVKLRFLEDQRGAH